MIIILLKLQLTLKTMTNRTFPNDEERLITFINLLPEQKIRFFLNTLLLSAIAPDSYINWSILYREYTIDVLSEYSNPKLSEKYKKFNASFDRLDDFLGDNFICKGKKFFLPRHPEEAYYSKKLADNGKETQEQFYSRRYIELKLELEKIVDDFKNDYISFVKEGIKYQNTQNLNNKKKTEETTEEPSSIAKQGSSKSNNFLQSIHLITESLEPSDVIFLVFNEDFNKPIRYSVKNHNGEPTYIKKLYDISYIVNVPNKKVAYSKELADNINNGLFRKRLVKKYMATNKFNKPTLVQKSEDRTILVLKNEIEIKTILIKNIPTQYQYLYIDKTK